jgi:hypothetical protein
VQQKEIMNRKRDRLRVLGILISQLWAWLDPKIETSDPEFNASHIQVHSLHVSRTQGTEDYYFRLSLLPILNPQMGPP